MITPAAAESYRWTDADGNVHYGDSLPPEYRAGHHARIDASGNAIETIEVTLEQAVANELAGPGTLDGEPRARDDDELLRMFANERDLRLTRDQRLSGMDNSIHWLERQLARTKDRLADLDADAPPEQRSELEHRMERREAALDRARAHKRATAAQFEVDLERMRELQGDQATNQ